jgi:uncharacterized protein YndB with AHSA1/START domain
MSKPKFVYATFIRATPEKVWEALTKADLTEKYWFGHRVSAEDKPGDHMTAISPAGQQAHRDPILESEPPRRLLYGWKPLYKDLPHEPPSRVTFKLKPIKGQTRMTVTYDELIFEMISGGWPAVLSSLKSFLEIGRGLESTGVEEEKPWLK